MVLAPCPHPTSATLAPLSSFSTTPSSAGSHDADQVRVITRAEKALRSLEQAGVMIAPLHAVAGLEVLERVLERMKGGLDDVVRAGHVDRSVRIGQAQRLLWTQRPLLGCGVVLHVSACALIPEPFADVALVGSCALRQLGRRHGAFRQFAIQPEPIADEDQRRTHRGAEIAHRLAEEFVQFRFVDSHGRLFSLVGSEASIVGALRGPALDIDRSHPARLCPGK